MAAYVIVDSVITDQAVFDDFLQQVPPIVEAHGGKYLGLRRGHRSGTGRLESPPHRNRGIR